MNLKNIARNLRKNMTKAEVRLWQRIRRKQINNLQFYRQKQIGNYVVDFHCPKKKLIIEIDGGHHYENGELVNEDMERENYLKNILKLNILRFTNDDVTKNIQNVVDKIIKEVE